MTTGFSVLDKFLKIFFYQRIYCSFAADLVEVFLELFNSGENNMFI